MYVQAARVGGFHKSFIYICPGGTDADGVLFRRVELCLNSLAGFRATVELY